jgi:osmotically-inducible protein OsmY
MNNKHLLSTSILALALLGTAGCAVTSGQSSVGQYVDDTTITTRVKTRFAEDKEVSAMRIQVETLNGTVQLSGFADSEAERARAADIARNVPDVKNVRNNIIVKPPTQ